LVSDGYFGSVFGLSHVGKKFEESADISSNINHMPNSVRNPLEKAKKMG
jgi:hypothetical protein